MRRLFFLLIALALAGAQTVLLVEPASAVSAPVISAPADGSTITDRTPLLGGTWDPSDGGGFVVQLDGNDVFSENAGIPGGESQRGWEYQVSSDLDFGEHTIRARSEALTGEVGTATTTFTVEEPAPEGPGAPLLFDPGNGALVANRVVAAGVIADGGTVPTSVRVFVDGDYVGNADLDGVDWRLTLPTLSSASHTVYAVARDDDGNDSSRSNSSTFTVDGTAPAVPVITAPADGYYENVNPTFRGTGEPGARLTIVYEYGTYSLTVPQSGVWEQDPGPLELGEGAHTFSVRQSDEAGNESPTSAELTYTYDATAPDAPEIRSPQTGDTLSDETFTVVGRGEIFATVTVLVNGQAVGTAVVDSDGDWSVTGIPSRPNGSREITATQADRADNESGVSNTVTIDVLLAPTVPSISKPVDGSYTNGGRVFDREIVGTADAGSTVRVLRDGVQIAEVTADEDGLWGYVPPAPFPDGTYRLTVTATNAAGTSQPSAAVTQTYDTVAPAAPVIESPTPNAFVRVATLTGTTEPGARVFLIFDGAVVEGLVATADSAGRWSLTYPGIPDNTYSFGVQAVDRAGNPGPSSAPVTFTLDTRAPAVPVVEKPVDGQRVGAQVPVNGQGEPNATVTVRRGGTVVGTAVVDSAGNWELVTDELDEGDVTLSVIQTDRAGNVSPAVDLDLVVDTAAPAAPAVTSPDNGEAIGREESVTFSGTAEPDASVTLRFDDGDPATADLEFTIKADKDGDWEWTPGAPLPEGTYTVTAVQSDEAGNLSTPSAGRRFIVDATHPAEPVVTTPTTGDTVLPLIRFQGRGEPGATINVNHFQDLLGTTTVRPDGTWSLTTTVALPEGVNTDISVQQVDPAGNASESSVRLTLIVDATPPPVITTPEDGQVYTIRRPTFIGTGTPGSTIVVRDVSLTGVAVGLRPFGLARAAAPGEILATGEVDEAGDWRATPTTDLVSAPYAVVADQTRGEAELETSEVVEFAVVTEPVITSPATGAEVDGSFEVGGTGEPGFTIEIVTLSDAAVDQPTVYGETVVGDDGAWCAKVVIADDGAYELVARQGLDGEFEAVSAPIGITVDSAGSGGDDGGDDGGAGPDPDSGDSLANTGGPAASAGLAGLVLTGLGGLTMYLSRRRLSSRRG